MLKFAYYVILLQFTFSLPYSSDAKVWRAKVAVLNILIVLFDLVRLQALLLILKIPSDGAIIHS